MEQLLPGIPNDICMAHIITKLPWRALYLLSSVSSGWRRAIQSCNVYDARVRARSTDKLIVHSHIHRRHSQRIAVFSIGDKCCYELPPIPQLDRGIPFSCQFISLDGKIFLLGAGKENKKGCGGIEVYVLDLAGQGQWKQCANMQGQRQRFGCGAIDGKIYIFGGIDSDLEPTHGSEVYDPKVDTWSTLMPMPFLRLHHHVAILGDELFLHGGGCYDGCGEEGIPDDNIHQALHSDVYHPAKDEWRVHNPFSRDNSERVFVAQGQFYSMSRLGIYVHDIANNSWSDLHSNSFTAIGPIDSVTVIPSAPVVVNDELLVSVYWYHNSDRLNNGACFLKSKGFGSENRELVWQVVSNCSSCFGDFTCSIEL